MARILRVLRDPEGPCAYLPDAVASLEHRVALDVSPEQLEAWLERGWRRFGPDYFRPACPACEACVPVRIDVEAFRPSASQQRVWKRANAFRLEYGSPEVDERRLELFRHWHENRSLARGWERQEMLPEHYRMQFAFPHPAARELAFYDGDRIVGVSICDETPNALSAAYFFYDPAYAKASLGTLNVLSLISVARESGKRFLYLGFLVADCHSLRYKGRFGARERLSGWPRDDEASHWTPETRLSTEPAPE
ncbi:MAG: arginyltransferase [Polyangiaceae bacterium]